MTEQPASAAPHPLVQGRCPACRGASLFLGSGGYVTCSRLDCADPSAADNLLHGEQPPAATARHLDLLQRGAWASAGRCPMCGWDNTSGRLCTDCTATVRNLPAGKRRKWRRYEPAHTGPPVQGPGYSPAQLLGSDNHLEQP